MLSRMFGTSGDGVHDRLMDFTRPVSGGLHFAPSLNALSKLVGLTAKKFAARTALT